MGPYGIDEFLTFDAPLFDVRSPAEYAHGHIPGAISLPLFSNEERAAVGTVYKKQGKKEALALGLKLTGPKLADLAAEGLAHTQDGRSSAKVYCWRGGMRSGSLAWLFDFSGIKTSTLKGGYKTFRRWVLEQFCIPRHLIVLGGMTGSGKTEVLQKLAMQNKQVIDLETLACHRGSSYGRLGMDKMQPSSEQFENEIAMRLSKMDPNEPIWIEDESRMVGTCHLPNSLYQQMCDAPMIFLDISREKRIERLLNEYGQFSAEELIAATQRIARQLGGQRTQEAIAFIASGQIDMALDIVLNYYDKTYAHTQAKHQRKGAYKVCIEPEDILK